MKYPKSLLLIPALAALSLASADAAVVITGTSATATTFFAAVQSPTNLVNNSGLSVANSITATHTETSNAADQWHSSGGVVDNESITISLGGSYDLENIYIWQANQTGLKNRGVNQFDLFYSTDGGTNYTAWTQNLNLAISPNTAAADLISAQSFAFGVSGVTNVRIEIDSAHSGLANDYVGLSEVKFTAVPEPAAALLGGLGLLGLLRRRR